MKTTLKGINSRLDDSEECINDLVDRIIENTQPEQQKERQIQKNENNFWNSVTTSSIPTFAF